MTILQNDLNLSFKPEYLIWSADISPEKLRLVIDANVLPEGMFIKLDQQFFLNALAAPLEGSELTLNDIAPIFDLHDLIGAIRSAGLRLFIDWKISEIPTKTEGIVRALTCLKPDMVNCMAGSLYTTGLQEHSDPQKVDGLTRFAKVCIENGIFPCGVTVLTSKDAGIASEEFSRQVSEQVLFYAKLMMKAGFTDLVCSAREATVIRQYPELNGLELNCPGIRLPDTEARDQNRTMTPREAFRSGVNRLVIGSNLTDGDEPDIVQRVKRNLERLITHIEGGA